MSMEDAIREGGEDLAAKVLQHIDTMYPAMWEGVPKAARTSLRNTIISRYAVEVSNYVDAMISTEPDFWSSDD